MNIVKIKNKIKTCIGTLHVLVHCSNLIRSYHYKVKMSLRTSQICGSYGPGIHDAVHYVHMRTLIFSA